MDYETFESLDAAEQARIFHESPFKEKGDLLLHARDPNHLARSLSQEELYLVTREMDLAERSEILRFANLPQLFFVSDMDCWKKDRLDPRGFIGWLETLRDADEGRLLAWLLEMDYETVVSGFQKIAKVIKPDREYAVDEILGDRPYFTLDESYFISVDEENLETVRRALEILYENHRGRYFALLEGVLGELEDELEETAYHRREMRLAERGFPDPETAHKIYRPLTPDEYENFPLKHAPASKVRPADFRLPNYPVLWSSEKLFLDEVLLLFRDDATGAREGLEEELAWLSNKVMACEGIDFSSEESVRHGVDRARSYLSIGLELLSGRGLVRARNILRERWLEIIFRGAVTQTLRLREEALSLVRTKWKNSAESFLLFLNPPYEIIFRGLFRNVPEYYDPKAGADRGMLRDFRCADEIERARLAVTQIQRAMDCLGDVSFLIDAPEDSGATLNALFGNLFARFVLNRLDRKATPLLPKEAEQFLQTGFEEKGRGRQIKAGLREKFVASLFEPDDAKTLRPFLGLVFEQMEEEFARFRPDQPIDPKYVSTFYLKPARARAKAFRIKRSSSSGKRTGRAARPHGRIKQETNEPKEKYS